MSFQRVPVDANEPFQPGKLYEIVLAHKGGDISRVTRSTLERALQQRYGQGVRVLDWGKRGSDLVIRLQVVETPQAAAAPSPAYGGGGCGSTRCPQPMVWYGGTEEYVYPAVLPLVLTAAAVAAVLYLVWRIIAELKEAVELVPAPARGIAVAGVGIGAGAMGLAALGVVALALTGRRRR
ncbi:hypothetical protein [Thermus caldifontis]|uniref:hypothetical protein n=1 Tax=Thermus caldifontis TaxID=1930763 RepID=UPI000DF27FA7|nr:hypothetical protein [Thermus caldifontis]